MSFGLVYWHVECCWQDSSALRFPCLLIARESFRDDARDPGRHISLRFQATKNTRFRKRVVRVPAHDVVKDVERAHNVALQIVELQAALFSDPLDVGGRHVGKGRDAIAPRAGTPREEPIVERGRSC